MRPLVLALGLMVGFATNACRAEEPSTEISSPSLVKKYCVDCHNGDTKEGNLDLASLLAQDSSSESVVAWWKVLKNLRAGVMPPQGQERPTAEEQKAIASWIKFDLFKIDPSDVDPGRIGVRRLNRREYANSVEQLTGVKFDAAIVFPPDDSGHGFDNIADALSMSPLLLEKYLRSAQTIIDQAVPRKTWVMPSQESFGKDFVDETGKINGTHLPGKKPSTVRRGFTIQDQGTYDVTAVVKSHGTFDFDPARYHVQFTIDGQDRGRHEYGWDENKRFTYQFVEMWEPGEHELVFELTPIEGTAPKEGEPRIGLDQGSTDAWFEVNTVRAEGPRGTTKFVHPRGYERFFTRDEPPVALDERRVYAEEILRKFATRAYRRPVEATALQRLVALAEQTYAQDEKTFEDGVAHAMVAVLASPKFLFRLEPVGSSASESPFALVDEFALASRLSYFVWSTMPDEELTELADSGLLRKNLPAQIKRMMASPKADEFVRNFVGQWLRTRDVTQVSVDPIVILGHQEEYERLREQFRNRRGRPLSKELSPEDMAIRKRFGEFRAIYDRFNDDMKRSMRRETEMCVEFIAKEDRSLLDLLDCDYTFVNERLASLYEIPDVKGNDMRRVTLPPNSPRGGVLTQGSMLLVTSNPTRTSPVKRGLFVLENILGTPSPPAPANVPELEESAKKFEGREPSLRELLASHRELALCSSCHSRMDPLGIALENFNALGMWREKEKEQPIDAAGKLITGEEFRDIRELKKILREHHAADFYRCVTEKMLIYAIGRGLEPSDEHTVDLIVERLIENDGRFSALMQGVFESAPFQKQRMSLPPDTTARN
jgi:hypothetical protein